MASDSYLCRNGSHPFSFRCSVDFFTGSFLCGFYFVVTVFDDRFSGYDPDEGALVIYHRYEVLINGAIQEIFHIGICMDRFVGGTAWNRHDWDSLCFLMSWISARRMPQRRSPSEMVPRYLPSMVRIGMQEYLRCSIFSRALAKSFILKDVGYFAFGNQKKQNVHVITSFPRKL